MIKTRNHLRRRRITVLIPFYQAFMPGTPIGAGEEWGRNLGGVSVALLSTAYPFLGLDTVFGSARAANAVAVALLLLATACNGPGPPESSTDLGLDATSSATRTNCSASKHTTSLSHRTSQRTTSPMPQPYGIRNATTSSSLTHGG